MKKVVLSLAVLFTVALVSCGNKKAEAVDSDTLPMDTFVAVEESVAATDSDTTVAVEAVEAVVPEEAKKEEVKK